LELAIGVGKSTGDYTDNEDKLHAEDDKDAESIGKNQMRIPGLSVFCPLLEDMLVKLTILYGIMSARILLVLPVIWP
jgi:hypothetical protein